MCQDGTNKQVRPGDSAKRIRVRDTFKTDTNETSHSCRSAMSVVSDCPPFLAGYALRQTPSLMQAPENRDKEEKDGLERASGAKTSTLQQPLSSPDSTPQDTAVVGEGGKAVTTAEEGFEREVVHLRRVNEALVERVDSMERSQPHTVVSSTTEV